MSSLGSKSNLSIYMWVCSESFRLTPQTGLKTSNHMAEFSLTIYSL